jgi:uncharacterized protein YndB with AHSA1/START domain
MSKLQHTIKIDAPAERVWKTLADLEAVQQYNPMVVRARRISAASEGVGAARECEFRPSGWARERVVGWEPGKALAIELYESAWPLTMMRWHTVLQAEGSGTRVSQETEFQLKFGPLGMFLDRLFMRRRFGKAIADVLAGLKRHVESGAGEAIERRAG